MTVSNNILRNGTVLPSGLLSSSSTSMGDAFKKTYQNHSLRVGIVIQSYGISDPNNINKRVPEYDVMTFEQNEDQGSTTIIYKRCPYATSFGSIADFFEVNLRKLTKKTTQGPTPSPSGQNGAIVLLLCLNSLSDTGIIVGALTHPDRPTTLVDDSPRLAGEYNGVAIAVNPDGSTSLTFNGATDNNGNIIDSSQGSTTLQIKTDGSFVLNHSTINLDLERSGDATITVKGNGNVTINASAAVNVNCENATVTAQQTATVEGTTVKLGKNASEAVIKGDTFKKYFDQHIHPTAVGPSGPVVIPMPASTLSTKVKTE